MRVVGAILLALCMLVIAGAAGAAVRFYLNAGMLESAMVAIATFALIALYHSVASRFGMRSVVSRQLADLSRGGADVARQVAELGRRLAALESKVDTALDQTRAITDPLNAQMGDLDTLVRRVSETMAAHQTAFDAIARTAAGRLSAPASSPAQDQASQTGREPDAPPTKEVSLETVRHAIDAGRIDLYLQPIVMLPRRKVRYYETMSRLRSETGESLQQSEFVPQAERGGLMPKVDQFVIFRCVRIVRRLLMKNREIGLFCNLSRTTLADASHVQQLCDFMAANRAIAPSLIFQFTYNDVREMAAAEHEKLATLAEFGFRFCLHEMASLRLEPSELALRGFRYVKVPAQLVLNRTGAGVSDARAGELAELLGRFGIDLIVDSIEDENSVIELLDHDVRYGQGLLFSPPRPVRAEALQTLPDMPDVQADGLAAATPRSGPVNSAPPAGNQSTAETGGAEQSSEAYLSSNAVGLG